VSLSLSHVAEDSALRNQGNAPGYWFKYYKEKILS
jgi:hypothetical protein